MRVRVRVRVRVAPHRIRVGLGRVSLAFEPADVLALDIGVRQATLVLLAALVARARRLHAEDAVDVGALAVEVSVRVRVG